MLCSYAERRDKHRVKATLNRILRAWMLKGGMTDAELPAARAVVERPLLLVAAEICIPTTSSTVISASTCASCAAASGLSCSPRKARWTGTCARSSTRCTSTGAAAAPGRSARRSRWSNALRPDLIFWPSVGMRHWGPAMANLRLAPIQFTALGHSASTFCDAIDYYLTEEGYVGDPALFSEQLVLLPDESLVFERSPQYRPVAPRLRERAQPLRVALPSNLLKLNPAFIAVLRRIQGAAGRPLEFHVFPNVSGIELHNTRRALARELRGSTVFGIMPYNRYLERLSACDLNLSPFPFGGLHSVVDSLRQGLPVVAMEGLEPHARTDAMLLRRLRMPEWLICKEVEGYAAAALRVIDDDHLRLELSRQALALDIDRVLYGDGATPLRTEVADAVWWLYRNHEAIQGSGRKVFAAADRVASSAV